LLTILVGAASTASGAPLQSESAAIGACQKIADRYRPLANAHPGESPLTVLATTPGIGITIDKSALTPISGAADLEEWGAKQNPPVIMDDVIKDVEALDDQGGWLDQIPKTNYYSFSNTEGTARCISSVYFTVSNGHAQAVPGPPGFAESPGGEACFIRRTFGVIDGVPAYFQEKYNPNPAMTSALTVGIREQSDFVGPCRLTFDFSPVFTKKTTNDWGDVCDRADCAGLRRDAFSLAKAVQSSPRKSRRDALSRLSAAQLSEYRSAEKLATAGLPPDHDPAKPAGPDPSVIMDDVPFHLPYLHDGQLYIASVGHLTLGGNPLGDWRVKFSQLDRGHIVERASFAVGMEKGKLQGIKISDSNELRGTRAIRAVAPISYFKVGSITEALGSSATLRMAD